MNHKTSLPALASLLLALPAAAQVTMYVAPQTSGLNGRVASGFDAALVTSGTTYIHGFGNFPLTTQPTGSPPTFTLTLGPDVTIRHRDDAGGALTGTYRNFELADLSTPFGPDRGLNSKFGSPNSPDMFEIEFQSPVGNWGAEFVDLESYIEDPAIVRAFDNSGTMIFEEPVQYPLGEDGENATNNAVNFVGLVSTTNNIKKVTVTVGNTQANYTAGTLDGENGHWIAIARMWNGNQVGRPTFVTTWANNNGLNLPGCVCFDMRCDAANGILVDSVDLHFGDAAGTQSAINVYGSSDLGNTWRLLATGQATASGLGLPTRVDLSTPLAFGNGCNYRLAFHALGLEHRYTNTNGPIPSFYDNGDIRIFSGYSNGGLPAATGNTPRTPNIRMRYTRASSPVQCPAADVELIGERCGAGIAALLDRMTPNNLPSANTLRYTFHPDGSVSYALEPQNVLPVGSVGAVSLYGITSSTSWPVNGRPLGTHGLHAHDQGAVSRGPLNLPLTINEGFFSLNNGQLNAQDTFYCTSGDGTNVFQNESLRFEAGVVGGFEREVFTYDLAAGISGGVPVDCQFVFDFHPGTNDLAEAWVTVIDTNVSPDPTHSRLIGYAPAGRHTEPFVNSPFDNATFELQPFQTFDLTITTYGGTPSQLVGAPKPFEVTTTGIPPGALLNYGVIGLSNPNVPLTFLGMEGCWAYASLDAIVGLKVLPGTTETWTALTMPPASNALTGTVFYVQGTAWGTPANGAFGDGVISSNGLRCTIGF